MSVTPYIFAPRIEFKDKIGKVKLNSESWHYFDGKFVFLPNRPGIYEIEVSLSKKAKSPHLSRTGALIESTDWEKDIFSFKAGLPVWTRKIPADLYFTAIVDFGGRRVKRVEGGEVIKEAEQVLVKFKPGIVKVFIE